MFVSAVGLILSLVDQLHLSQCLGTYHRSNQGTSMKTTGGLHIRNRWPRQCSKVKLYKLKCGMLNYQHLGTEFFWTGHFDKFE